MGNSETYHSRNYIREKWDSLKRDIENVLDIYNEEVDSISSSDIDRVKWNIKDKIDSILQELNIKD